MLDGMLLYRLAIMLLVGKSAFISFLLSACLCVTVLFGCVASDAQSASSRIEFSKVQTNLGLLESDDGELVLALNTEVTMTTLRSDVRDQVTAEAQEQVFSLHKLLDGYRYYRDDAGEVVVNVAYINDHFGEGPVKVDRALFDLIEESILMAELTEGYFNPTVGKLVDVYEGRLAGTAQVQDAPDAQDVEEARNTVVPYDKLRSCILLDEAKSTVELAPCEGSEYALNVGAIGKGFALSRLAFSQDESYLVTAGASSIRGHVGTLEDDVTWNVATHEPDGTDLLFAFRLDEGSVSTSGDDESFYLLEDGTRVHHILNPHTGYSENHYRNVVLVGQDAGVLDALSTALFSVGDLDAVKEMIERVEDHAGFDISYCLVVQEGDGYRLEMDEAFEGRLLPEYTSDLVLR